MTTDKLFADFCFDLVIRGSLFPHKTKHEVTWMLPPHHTVQDKIDNNYMVWLGNKRENFYYTCSP